MGEVRRYKRWTRAAVEESFRAFAERHGRPPKHDELGIEGLPYSRTVERLYGGSFDAAIQAAGFTPRGIGRPRRRHGVRIAS